MRANSGNSTASILTSIFKKRWNEYWKQLCSHKCLSSSSACHLGESSHLSQGTDRRCSHTSTRMCQFYFYIYICMYKWNWHTCVHVCLERHICIRSPNTDVSTAQHSPCSLYAAGNMLWVHTGFAAFLAEVFFLLNVIHCFNLSCFSWSVSVSFFFSFLHFLFNTYHRCTTVQNLVTMVTWCLGLVQPWDTGTSVI